jgi:hypothetical protein
MENEVFAGVQYLPKDALIRYLEEFQLSPYLKPTVPEHDAGRAACSGWRWRGISPHFGPADDSAITQTPR